MSTRISACCRWIVLAPILALFIQAPLRAETKLQLESPLAMVNGVVIANQDLDVETGLIKAEMDYRNRELTAEELSGLLPQLTQLLIDRELLYQQAQKRNIQVRDRWIDRAVGDLKSRLGGEKAYRGYLQAAGAAEDQFRERVAKGLIIKRFMHREVLRQIKVNETEMQIFYRQHPEIFMQPARVRARQIMAAVDADATEDKHEAAVQRLMHIQRRLERGESFAVLALEYSDCPSKTRGGDLGYFSREDVLEPLSRAAFALEPGQTSDIIATRHGYHIVQCLDYSPPAQMAYNQTREKIERTIRRNKEKEAAEAYLANLRKTADIMR